MTFEARYRGTCGECREDIVPGQEVEYQAGKDRVLVHAPACPEPADDAPPRAVCPRCYMELPVSGECGSCG